MSLQWHFFDIDVPWPPNRRWHLLANDFLHSLGVKFLQKTAGILHSLKFINRG